ncbi:MAG: hypothetical protein LBK72_04705 [Bifidobacteriaceae bacterium]|jgi:hypothetical protein|nr:hypothetical protein [Bifidobacteriaceae bacterium]
MTTLRSRVIVGVMACLVTAALPPMAAPGSALASPPGEGAGLGAVTAKKTPELSGSVSADRSYLGRTAVTFGLHVQVDGRGAVGHVSFREGETRIGRVRLRDGFGVYTLPTDLPRGKHSLTLAFEPSAATAETVDTAEWTYTITVKKPSASRDKKLAGEYCGALQLLAAAKVATIKGGIGPDRAEYRAYTKAAAKDPSAKGKRYWTFLRDLGPGVRLGKVATSASVYLRYGDFKPSTAQKYQTKALATCVG